MKKVCVITGGGSGMGLAAAKFMDKKKIIVLSGRTVSKLEKAVDELSDLGFEAHGFSCDTSSRDSVRKLVEYASGLGEISNVINAAGLSPAMAKPEQLIRVNALGTVFVNQEFGKVMDKGSVILDVSSNSAYVLPEILINYKTFALAESDENLFIKKMVKKSNLPKDEYKKSGFAYALSKKFAIWYAAKSAFNLGQKGVRVLSLSPGLVSTEMGNLEKKEGASVLQYTCENRMGTPDELGFAIASAVDERNGYLSGVDILCDGGSTVGKKFKFVKQLIPFRK